MRTISLFAMITIATTSFAQSDTVVVAEGKILNASTKEPIVAKISYQSLPFGNIVGSQNNSSYRIALYDNSRYSIIVEAVGFQTAKYMLDPSEANGELKLIKDIELSAGMAPDAHLAGQVMRLNNLIFDVGKSRISPESYGELETVVAMMRENEKMIIQLEGHTDYQGNPKTNLQLSKERVDAVKKYLVEKGISTKRIKIKAFGGTQPLSRDNTEEAHRLNRRVELRILSN